MDILHVAAWVIILAVAGYACFWVLGAIYAFRKLYKINKEMKNNGN